MARIVLGPMVSDARGKQGGLVYSRNAAGHYVRAKVSPVQPRTPPQLLVRASMTACAQYWSGTLTPAQRAAWEDYAGNTPIVDRFGAKQNISGIAMFLRFNTWWYTDGGVILAAAPAVPGEAPMEVCTLEATVANGFRCTAINTPIGAGDRVAVQVCKEPTSVARNYYGGPFTANTAWGNATAFPQNIVAVVAIGQQWWVRVRYYDALGKTGPVWIGSAKCTA